MTQTCGLQLFHIFGVKKAALEYPVIPKAEQLPGFRFFMLKQKQNLRLQIYRAVGNIRLANHLQSSPATVNFPRFSGATKDP